MKIHKHVLQAIVTFPSIVLENILEAFINIWKQEQQELNTNIELDPEENNI